MDSSECSSIVFKCNNSNATPSSIRDRFCEFKQNFDTTSFSHTHTAGCNDNYYVGICCLLIIIIHYINQQTILTAAISNWTLQTHTSTHPVPFSLNYCSLILFHAHHFFYSLHILYTHTFPASSLSLLFILSMVSIFVNSLSGCVRLCVCVCRSARWWQTSDITRIRVICHPAHLAASRVFQLSSQTRAVVPGTNIELVLPFSVGATKHSWHKSEEAWTWTYSRNIPLQYKGITYSIRIYFVMNSVRKSSF